jgi:glutathione-regulated potassium-efflux system ancillary protein KefF
MHDVLVLAAHPALHQSRAGRRLRRALREAALPGVLVRDLYEAWPDFFIDVPTEQSLLAPARLVVWLHPIQWYSMPALMKLWVDEVLQAGWAHGAGGLALQGKALWLVATTGASEGAYTPEGHHGHAFEAFLPPYRQTAALCGMRFLQPLLLHDAHRLSDEALDSQAAHFVDTLRRHCASLRPEAAA